MFHTVYILLSVLPVQRVIDIRELSSELSTSLTTGIVFDHVQYYPPGYHTQLETWNI